MRIAQPRSSFVARPQQKLATLRASGEAAGQASADFRAKGSARAGGAARGQLTIDVFQPAPSSMKQTLKQAAGNAAKSALGSVAEKALTSVMSRLFESIAKKLGQAIERFLSRARPAAPQLPAETPAPAQPPVATQPVSPPVTQPGGLAPTPLGGEKPGQIAHVNTIQEPHIAPRSQFRDVVNQAIDAARAKGLGIDPQDPDRITDYDKYHSAVVMELRARGYNANYDGEELAVGRANDSFNEQFDISTSTGLVRRFYASWVSPPVWA